MSDEHDYEELMNQLKEQLDETGDGARLKDEAFDAAYFGVRMMRDITGAMERRGLKMTDDPEVLIPLAEHGTAIYSHMLAHGAVSRIAAEVFGGSIESILPLFERLNEEAAGASAYIAAKQSISEPSEAEDILRKLAMAVGLSQIMGYMDRMTKLSEERSYCPHCDSERASGPSLMFTPSYKGGYTCIDCAKNTAADLFEDAFGFEAGTTDPLDTEDSDDE